VEAIVVVESAGRGGTIASSACSFGLLAAYRPRSSSSSIRRVANDDYYYYDGGAPATGGEGRR
jgi:hypothetical protein